MNSLYPLVQKHAPPSGGAGAFRLFPLEPLNVGGDEVESLTSYLTRLGNEHWVSPQYLYTIILRHEFGIDVKIKVDCSLNTYSQTSRRFADALSRSSPLDFDFSSLTFANMRSAFPDKAFGMFTTRKAWCPHCYQDMHEAGVPLHDKLIWSLKPAARCLEHKIKLHSECSKCGKTQKMIVPVSVSGHCQSCGHPLRLPTEQVTRSDDVSSESLWRLESCLELLRFAQRGGEFCLATLKQNIVQLRNSEFGGSQRRMARELNMPADTLRGLLVRGHRPSFPRLLQLCYRLGIPPVQLFSRNGQLDLANRVEKPVRPYVRPPYLKQQQIDQKRRLLRSMLASQDEFGSTTEVAKQLGINRNTMSSRMPAEYEELLSRVRKRLSREKRERDALRIDKIRRFCREMIELGVYPSDRKVKAHAGVKASEIRQPEIRAELRKAQDEYWQNCENLDQTLLNRIKGSSRKEVGTLGSN